MRLSTRITLLVLGSLLPVLAAQIYSQFALHAARQSQLAAIAFRQASLANNDVTTIVQAVGQIRTVLADFRDTMADPQSCSDRLTAIERDLPQYRFLGLYRADGSLLCGSDGVAHASVSNDPTWLAAMAGTNRLEFGPVAKWQGASLAVLPIGAGLAGEHAENAAGVLVADLDLHWLSQHLDAALTSHASVVPHAELIIADRQGTIIADSSDDGAKSPAELPLWLRPLLDRPTAGAVTVTDPQGRVFLAGYVPLSVAPQGIAAIETVPLSDAMADVERAARQDLIVLGGAAALGIFLAWIAGRRFIYAPTEALLQAVGRWRDGDLGARAKLSDAGSEFATLAEAFNAMAAVLQARDAELALHATMLEAQVAERTRALSETNNRLQVEIAERAKTEAALHQAQKLQAVGQLAGGIAHDFNNMLATVLGNLELMQRRFGQTDRPWTEVDHDRMLRLVDRASGAVQRGSRLTSRLLAFSRRQRLSPRPIDINALLRDLITLARSTLGSRIQITADLEDGLWAAMADPSQVEAAILNLCLNSRDAMPDGGTLIISTANTTSEAVTLTEDRPQLQLGDYVRICVRDSGFGMTAEVRARAFDPFFTTKGPSGTGLGLSQVYGTARQSGGDVSIRSQPGEGTEISLYLPRSLEIAHLASDDRPERVRLSRNGHETVLVVDDDDEVRQVTVDMLRHLGFVVVEADSGHAALDLIDTLPASPGFILLDYAMPEMSGLKLAQALRQRGVSAPMALVTGYADLSEADLVSAGFIDVLHKPFTMQGLRDLVVLLRQSIEERRPEAVSHSA